MLLGLFVFPVAIHTDGERSRETRVVATPRQQPSSRQTLWSHHRTMPLLAGGEFVKSPPASSDSSGCRTKSKTQHGLCCGCSSVFER